MEEVQLIKTNRRKSTIAFVFSLASFVFIISYTTILGFAFACSAILLSVVARKEAKEHSFAVQKFTTAALVLGIIGFFVNCVSFAIYLYIIDLLGYLAN